MKKFGVILVGLNILVLDGVMVYWFLFKNSAVGREVASENDLQSENFELSGDTCGSECQKYIDSKLSQFSARVSPILTPTKVTESAKATSVKTKIKSVSYIPIPGTGSTTNTDWTTLPGTDFYVSKVDYPGITGAYFEANMKLTNGNGKAYLRLYDVTHSIGVTGSEISSSNQTSTFVTSGNIALWEGYNHYAVQAKSLTADTTVFESGKLKIISEN